MTIRLAVASSLIAFALPIAAQAAPQALGVVSSAAPIPMTCDGNSCTAELSAICLQRDRSGPREGTAYEAVDPGPLTLIAVAADGSTRTVPGRALRFATARNYNAVTASVPVSLRDSLGAVRLEIAVGPRLTLAPVAVEGDPQPQTPKDIAEAAGTLDAIATDMLATDQHPGVVTAQVLNRLINALPDGANWETIDLASDDLWRQVVGGKPQVRDSRPGMADAALAYESCRRGATYVQGLTLRRCLEASHDALMSSINEAYWQAASAGS